MNGKPLYPVPRRSATVAMLFFLAALGVLFAASLVAYFAIRLTGSNNPAGRTLHFPFLFWISTAVMVAASVTIARALAAVRAERRNALRMNLLFTLALAVTFIAIQTPALIELLRAHERVEQTGLRLYGMLFVLVLLHAAHVLGGVVMLLIVTRAAVRGQYDHERYAGVRNAAWYWHFLDVVWLVMFLSLWTIG